jgi:hypothetical protein
LTSLAKHKSLIKECCLVFHQTRYAVMWIIPWYCYQENDSSLLEFQTWSLIFVLTQSKNCHWRHGVH